MMVRLFISILTLSFLFSCQNCVCLRSDGLRPWMISYDSTEIDTLIVRKFEKGTHFSKLIDTLQWDRSNVFFSARSDTFELAAYRPTMLVQSQFDYQVFIPATRQTFNISEINEPQATGNCRDKTMCVNKIISCRINDDSSITLINGDVLYLKK